MTFEIHITVTLQPSPQLVELLQAMQPRQPEHKQPAMPSMGETETLLQPGPEQPQIKPQEAREEPKGPAPEPHEPQNWDPLVEIPRFPISACTTPEHIPVPETSPHFEYIETDNGRLWFRYISGNIWTTWEQIMKLEKSLPANQKKFGKLLGRSDLGNRRTAVNYMIKAIRAGLGPGQAKELYEKMKGVEVTNSKFWTGQEKTPGDQKEPVDPDADFRQLLNQDTRIAQDGNKLEGSLED